MRHVFTVFTPTYNRGNTLAQVWRLLDRSGLMLAAPLSDNCHTSILRFANDPQDQVSAQQTAHKAAFSGPSDEYLRDLIPTCKIHDGRGRIIAFQSPCLDVQISCKIQVLLDGLDVSCQTAPFTAR
jgi:hypothetical protein